MKNKDKRKAWRFCSLNLHDIVSVRVEPKWLNPDAKYVEVIFANAAGDEGRVSIFGPPGMTVAGWGDFPKRRERTRKKVSPPAVETDGEKP